MDRVKASIEPRASLHLLTGFLGSGKTSLLKRYLAASGGRHTAVLINEFGEIGLDHRLVRHGDATVRVLEGGCVCCSVSRSLQDSLIELLSDRKRDAGSAFSTVVIETSGLAVPAPILASIASHYALAEYFRFGSVVAAVDAVNALESFERYPEIAQQVCAADRIVITKTDLVPAAQVAALTVRVREMNPLAVIESANALAFRSEAMFNERAPEALRQSAAPVKAAAPHDSVAPATAGDRIDSSVVPARGHASRYRSFTLNYREPLDWAAFSLWLTALLNRHGIRILRFKAILALAGQDARVIIHGVQHLMYPPRHIDEPRNERSGSTMVFIVQDMERDAIEDSLERFMRAADAALGYAPHRQFPARYLSSLAPEVSMNEMSARPEATLDGIR